MPDSFKTISSLSEGIYKEKGSKFLSFAIPVKDLAEIKPILDNYRKSITMPAMYVLPICLVLREMNFGQTMTENHQERRDDPCWDKSILLS